MAENLLTIEEAAEYTGLCTSTLRRLQKRGELFPEKKGKACIHGGLRSLFLREDLDDLRALYPRHDRNLYYTCEQAARLIGVGVETMRAYHIPCVKELRRGKWCNMYLKKEVANFLKQRNAEALPPAGYITAREAAAIVGMHHSNIRRYSELNKVRVTTYRVRGVEIRAYNKRDIIRWAAERRKNA